MRAALLARQNPDGGLGARPGLPSATEPTALAVLALSFEPDQPDTLPLRAWLRARQTPEHAWPVMAGLQEPSWTTALAVLALARYPEDAPLAERGAAWLTSSRGKTIDTRGGLLGRLFGATPTNELDGTLVGWPWVDGTFSWVEPTAYALLALRAVSPPPAGATARIAEGERLLLDRVCRDGGWNYGNRRVLGEDLWSYPDTTALAVLALGRRADRGITDRALACLESMLTRNHSGLATALGVLALAAHGRDVHALRERLQARFEATGFAGDSRALAWAVLASNAAAKPFGEPGRA
ncbi:MAG TPA: hypothetical protein VNO26_06065 [Candidatus Limnocylindria bacterium]|nr:hypothetical protein [Candidatus Limnocylindria bacterium]